MSLQTGQATSDIAAQITSIQGATENAVTAIRGIVGTIKRLNAAGEVITAAVREQNEVTQEIAAKVRGVSADAAMVSNVIIDVTRSASVSFSGTIQVLWTAQDIDQPTSTLAREVDVLLDTLRTT